MAIDSHTVLSLFPNADDIPACDEGIELAKRFLEGCGDTVADLDRNDEIDLRFRFFCQWNDYVEHRTRVREVQRGLNRLKEKMITLLFSTSLQIVSID